MAIPYRLPRHWILYDRSAIQEALIRTGAAVLALQRMPAQREWAEELQRLQLKREIAGTSRIEGAEFTEDELQRALSETAEQLETRSQRQAAAAVATYRWIAALPNDRPVDDSLIREIHRRLVTGCDDDHCPPGVLRESGANVTFGAPRHRGVEGGAECAEALRALVEAGRTVYREHHPIVQALAFHYHFAAMHPFLDGNGRTARALEALLLQRLGLRDTLFIAMSNYYYENKMAYLNALSDTQAAEHDLTPFLTFAIRGIEQQCENLLAAITLNVKKALFRNTVTDLFGRLQTPRKRAISERQVHLLNLLMDESALPWTHFRKRAEPYYTGIKNPMKALVRDVTYLDHLGALRLREQDRQLFLSINLNWPMEITETEFFQRSREMPKSKFTGFLSR